MAPIVQWETSLLAEGERDATIICRAQFQRLVASLRQREEIGQIRLELMLFLDRVIEPIVKHTLKLVNFATPLCLRVLEVLVRQLDLPPRVPRSAAFEDLGGSKYINPFPPALEAVMRSVSLSTLAAQVQPRSFTPELS